MAGSIGALPIAAGAQQTLPAPLAQGPGSSVPVAIQTLRWHMLDGDVNALTFRSMDTLFTTRSVPRSGPVWQLLRADRPLNFTYRHNGNEHSAEDFLERTYTNALIVMKNGRIVTEIYRNNSDARTRFIGWSMTKSITSVLVGCALAEGRIRSLDDPITDYLPELRGGGYEGASIRDVLEMRSGVDYEERYDFANPGVAAQNHISALVKNVSRFADPARTIRRLHAPGEVFQYKTLDTAVLGWLLERVSGQSVAAYTAQRLWEPLGAEFDGYYIMDGEPGVGREFSGAGFNATLRDFARFGQMMLDGGVADGRRIVPAEWVDLSTRSAFDEDSRTGGYGLQWWTAAGSDSYYAAGLQGQFIYIDPASRTVVVKLSYFPPADESAGAETLAFLAAASAWSPR
ncbi:serine hydrolase [Sphingosinicella sp. CPCC 101087]|uniref:serine hydrolase domain-containing protein n=1 Tax=Sphingosinicella sp. CPCC 101087 TaxID=2497754 RepID=UPI001FB15028|nr:serine hydrolase [Sphingosinicella sp. CPCC 101087]